MKKVSILISTIILFTACNNKQVNNKSTIDNNENSSTEISNLDSIGVETRTAETTYKPAFSGQTRAKFIKTQTPYSVDIITENLNPQWEIINLPGGKLLTTDKFGGYFNIIDLKNPSVPKKVTGLPPISITRTENIQGGLLGVILDPNFEKNRTIYWSYSEAEPNKPGYDHTSIAKGVLSADETKVENVQVIYRANVSHNSGLHYGGRMAFDKDGYLFATISERSDPETRVLAQDLSKSLGKVIRITTDGKPAPGNPFVGKEGALPEIYSYGHRNILSLVYNSSNSKLWVIEQGPRGGDEVNLIQPGKNYGWPIITYGIEYSGEKINGGLTQKEGMEQPIYYWDPVIAPSGGDLYSGNIDEWKGNIFLGGLKNQLLARLVIKDDKVIAEEHLMTDQKDRIRDMVTGTDGNLYVVGDGGKIYKISKK